MNSSISNEILIRTAEDFARIFGAPLATSMDSPLMKDLAENLDKSDPVTIKRVMEEKSD